MNLFSTLVLVRKKGGCPQRQSQSGASVRWLPIWLFLWLIPGTHQAQRLSFDHLSMQAGLPSEGAMDIIQAEDGYIWLANFNGLVRYDGYDFTVFRGSREDGLSSQPVGRSFVSLLQSRDRSIWASSLTYGISRYLPEEERFVNYLTQPDSTGDIGDEKE